MFTLKVPEKYLSIAESNLRGRGFNVEAHSNDEALEIFNEEGASVQTFQFQGTADFMRKLRAIRTLYEGAENAK